MAKIVITDLRDGSKQRFDLPVGGILTIGRQETQDIVLNHNKISRKHAELTYKDSIFKVRDVGSSNGTFLNNKRLSKGEETIIFGGDQIRVAEFEVELIEDGDADSATSETPAHKAEPKSDEIYDKEESPSSSPRSSLSGTKIPDLERLVEEYGGSSSGSVPTIAESKDRDSAPLGDSIGGALAETTYPQENPFADKEDAKDARTTDQDDEHWESQKLREEEAEKLAAYDDDDDGPSHTPIKPGGPPPESGVSPLDAQQAKERLLKKLRSLQGSHLRRKLTEEERKKSEILFEIKNKIQDRILQYMDLRNLDFTEARAEDIRERTKAVIRDIITEIGDQIPRWASKKQIAKEVLDEALGLGPLEDYLADDSITEVMVNAYDEVYIERHGRIEEAPVRFSSNQAVLAVIERIVGPIGRRIDESSPMVDARLKDGSRVNAIIPPLALKGPSITIRKFSKTPFTLEDLLRFGTMNEAMAEFLMAAIAARKNIVVSGGTGSGKTTLLNVLSNFIPNNQRIVTIENVAELQLSQDHVVGLESRPPNIEGRGEISVRDLVKNSLRMRPDRIVIGECRGGEAIDMIQAMNTGHDGSLTTLHANSPADALSRLETMSLMAGLDLPSKAIRDQIMSAVNVVVQTNRFSDGTRKVTHITEVLPEIDEHYRIQTRDIFRFKQTALGDSGEVLGSVGPTGYRPTFLEELNARGFGVDDRIFQT